LRRLGAFCRKLSGIVSLVEHEMVDRLLVCGIDRIGLGVVTVTPHEEIDVKSYEGILMASIKAIRAEEGNEKRIYASLRSRIFNFKNRKESSSTSGL